MGLAKPSDPNPTYGTTAPDSSTMGNQVAWGTASQASNDAVQRMVQVRILQGMGDDVFERSVRNFPGSRDYTKILTHLRGGRKLTVRIAS